MESSMTANPDSPAPRPDPAWGPEIAAELEANWHNGRVGRELRSETDDFRVWTIRLAPGERVAFHRHQLKYFWMALAAGRSRSRFWTGETRETEYREGDVRHFDYGAGEFMIHDLENIGDTELSFVTVEFKHGPNPPLPIEAGG
jgi:quercetin dioxygenase-like cupin family protein